MALTLLIVSCSGEHHSYLTKNDLNTTLRSGKPIQDNSPGPILFVTHPSTAFDVNKVAKPVIDKVLHHFVESGLPHYVMTIDPSLTSNYPDDYPRANKYISFSGAHALSFTKARQFILTGGHLLFCLCETLRDVILSMPVRAELEFTFLTDGIYMPGPNSDGTWGKSYEDLRPIELFSRFLADFSDDYLVHFVETEILHNGVLCQQNPFPPYSLLPAEQLTIQIKRKGTPLKLIGHGPRSLIFNFTDSSSI
jgi:hypothetical protein